MSAEDTETEAPHVPSLLWEVRLVHPRDSGKRTMYVQTYLVAACTPEDAQRKVAVYRGEYDKLAKVGLGQPFIADPPVCTEAHFTDRTRGEGFRGRLVSDVLCEIAVEGKQEPA